MIKESFSEEEFGKFNEVVGELKNEEGNWVKKADRTEVFDSMLGGLDAKSKRVIISATESFIEVDFWGINDYVTNIERGTFKLLDQNDQVRAVKRTMAEAKTEADTIVALGEAKKIDIVNEYSKLDPVKKRKGVLKGEENIFEALRSYAFAIRKRHIVEPLVLEIEKEFVNNKDVYTPNMQNIIKRQVKELRGVYSWEDKFIDSLFESKGTEPFKATRAVGKARQLEGYLKLGYRPVAAAVNLIFGHHHTVTKVGLGKWAEGIKFLRTPEGKAFAEREEPYMGLTFSQFEGAGKEVKSFFNPLWLFSRPERGIRRVALASNYLDARQSLGMSDIAAREYAQRAMRAQSFVYNTTALPRWMRTPLGKLTGQFKAYIVQEMQFLAGLSGKEWARYLTGMAMFGGPQAILHMMSSIPFLENLGVLDKVQEFLFLTPNQALESLGVNSTVPIVGDVRPAFGLPGLIGADISISAALQFPSSVDQLAGPFLSDVLKLGKMVYQATRVGPGEAFGFSEFQDAEKLSKSQLQTVTSKLGQFAVQIKYIDDVLQANYKFQPDGRVWVRDSKGNLLYPIHSNIDYVNLVLGAKPVQKSIYQTKIRQFQRERSKRVDTARAVMRRGLRLFSAEKRLPNDFVDDLLKVGFTNPNSLVQAITEKALTPEQRSIMGENFIDQLKAIDLFHEELYREFGDDVLEE